jgi:predicted CopG family antitoxin
MKTITLDEAAYERLKAWKLGPKDSFSSVVKRVMPVAGTLGAFVDFVEANRTDKLVGNDLMERSIEERSAVKEGPWN